MKAVPNEFQYPESEHRLVTLVDDWGIAIYPLSAWERMRAEARLGHEEIV